jgi:hypothetical protein
MTTKEDNKNKDMDDESILFLAKKYAEKNGYEVKITLKKKGRCDK